MHIPLERKFYLKTNNLYSLTKNTRNVCPVRIMSLHIISCICFTINLRGFLYPTTQAFQWPLSHKQRSPKLKITVNSFYSTPSTRMTSILIVVLDMNPFITEIAKRYFKAPFFRFYYWFRQEIPEIISAENKWKYL